MNNQIIGTAGHVDHGKTLLIKALTGIETDRLQEEKKRGITIELGFAYLDLPNGQKAGIIDVPGHEKFVRNMLAGAGSIDLAMLVIAADEGIMPQTREHLSILNNLGIKRGLVVINKIDLVDEDWLTMVELDIEEELAGSFLEGAPMQHVSAFSGQGINELRGLLFEMLKEALPKKLDLPFRLPIDRVFTMDGFGTVVTGTLIEGRLNTGQDVALYPTGQMAKARRVQVHGKEVGQAVAGQRVALNLAGLKISDIEKGHLVAEPKSLENSRNLEVVIEIDKNCNREIRHNSMLHFHHGTTNVLCRLILFDAPYIKAGQRSYARLKLLSPIAPKIKDRFVLRFYSPMETIGGGVILDVAPKRVKRDTVSISHMEIKEKGSLAERIEIILREKSEDFLEVERIKQRYFIEEDFEIELAKLIKSGRVYIVEKSALHKDYLEDLAKRAKDILAKYHKENPLHTGMNRLELIARILPYIPRQKAEASLETLTTLGHIKKINETIANADFAVKANKSHKEIGDKLMAIYLKAGYASPDINDVAQEFAKEKKAFTQALELLIKNGELIALTPKIHTHKQVLNNAIDTFKALADNNKEVTLADFRDAIGASRKYALAFLEYFDKIKMTKKMGEGRILM